jgi:hypothetical protein
MRGVHTKYAGVSMSFFPVVLGPDDQDGPTCTDTSPSDPKRQLFFVCNLDGLDELVALILETRVLDELLNGSSAVIR